MRHAYLQWIDLAIDRICRREFEKGREGAVTRWPPYQEDISEETLSEG